MAKQKQLDVDNFGNVQIIRKQKDDFQKPRQGKDWWSESQAIDMFKKAENDGKRQKYWNSIVEKTPIRKMEIQIDGSGDSGGIEDIELYDEADNLIECEYKIATFHMLFNLNNEEWDKLKTKRELDDDYKADFRQLSNDWSDSRTTYTLNKEGYDECMNDFQKALKDGWSLLSIDKNNPTWHFNDTYVMYQKGSTVVVPHNAGWYSWLNEKAELMFESCNHFNHQAQKSEHALSLFVDSMYYGILPGGWEINEGSSNKVTITNKKIAKENYPIINVDHYYYREDNENYEIDSHDFLSYMKHATSESMKFNLDTKKGSDEFYEFVEKLRDRRYQ